MREQRIDIRVSADELARYKASAHDIGVPLSEWLREAARRLADCTPRLKD